MSTGLNLIKELREKTGVGFLDCKIALKENNNNLEASIDYLRKKGLAKASKKSSRDANEGVVSVYNTKNKTVLLKVNTETDFAAKNDVFLNFVDEIGNIAIKFDSYTNKDDFLDQRSNKRYGTKTHYSIIKINEYGEEIVEKNLKNSNSEFILLGALNIHQSDVDLSKIIFDKIVDFHRGCWYKTIDTSLSDFALLDTKIPKMELTL